MWQGVLNNYNYGSFLFSSLLSKPHCLIGGNSCWPLHCR